VTVLLLSADDEQALEELLLVDPAQNLFLLGLMDAAFDSVEWFGTKENGRLTAVAAVYGKLCVPWSSDRDCSLEIGRALRDQHKPQMLVGPRQACDDILSTWADAIPHTRYDQRLYVLDQAPPIPEGAHVELAQRWHAPRIAELSAAMQREDLGRELSSSAAHQAVVMDRIDEERTWIATEGREIVFVINVGTRHLFGCQVGGTYVPPKHRGRGIATRHMAELGARLLDRYPCVTLHVNEANTAAVRVYERAGFRRAAPFRLLMMEDR